MINDHGEAHTSSGNVPIMVTQADLDEQAARRKQREDEMRRDGLQSWRQALLDGTSQRKVVWRSKDKVSSDDRLSSYNACDPRKRL